MLTPIATTNAPNAVGPYSQAIKANGLVFCSGQVSLDPATMTIVEGGIESWKRAGLPVMKDASQPLELQRQVQLIAGFLIVLGAVLSVSVSPVFVWLSAFVGAGLMLAGATGWCGMAT
ncbi:MAG TPA: DUF2892 domain-containing protein, partial [Hyphomicrobiaceae bacterium]|nr:DUF2892 domain-containing protein [Hyphomicrobiaceae bacterium]